MYSAWARPMDLSGPGLSFPKVCCARVDDCVRQLPPNMESSRDLLNLRAPGGRVLPLPKMRGVYSVLPGQGDAISSTQAAAAAFGCEDTGGLREA
jgi:hypothetical protein